MYFHRNVTVFSITVFKQVAGKEFAMIHVRSKQLSCTFRQAVTALLQEPSKLYILDIKKALGILQVTFLKGQCHGIFCFRFLSMNHLSPSQQK
jgi:hypothetical protein